MSSCPAVLTRFSDAPVVDAFQSSLRTLLSAEQTDGRVGVIHIIADPRSGPPLHLHEREDELFYVESGDIGFVCGDQRWRGGPGTQAFLPRGVPHTWYNLSDTPARLIVSVVPGGFEAFFKAVADATADLPDPTAMLAEVSARFGIDLLGPNPLATPEAELV
jgi:mannose-6-phosphate isomerase-like protein (cupin superfamily)